MTPWRYTYRSWQHMMGRCYNPNNNKYPQYGELGITVCKRWHDFNAFYEDMGVRPQGTWLDRRNNDKGYSKSNCRWATPHESNRNRRSVIFVIFKGHQRTVTEWCQVLGLNRSTVSWRMNKDGQTAREALEML